MTTTFSYTHSIDRYRIRLYLTCRMNLAGFIIPRVLPLGIPATWKKRSLLASVTALSMASSTQAAVIFSESSGYLTSVQFTSDVTLNVSSSVNIVNNPNGYNLIFSNIYSSSPASASSTGTGTVLSIAGTDRNSVSSQVGLLAGSITTTDLSLLFGGNGSGFTSIATGQQFTVRAGTFNFASSNIPTPTNLGSNVSIFITPNGGSFGFDQITDSVAVAVPEPSASGLAMLALGALGLAYRRRPAKQAQS